MEQLTIQADLKNPPIGAILTAELVKGSVPTKIVWGNSGTTFKVDNAIFNTSASIARYLARISPQLNLYRSTSVERAEVDHWITFSLTPLSCEKHFADAISSMNDLLNTNKFLVGESISLADVTVWALLYSNAIWRNLPDKEKKYNGIYRWYESLLSDERFKNVISKLPSQAKEPVSVGVSKAKSDEKKVGRKDEGKFVDLPDAEMGKVIVRFPPEPSGYLHIGHAKAALLNQHYQQAFKGKLILRFDDTNPAKENEEFERVIMEDLQMLEIKQDMTTHTSDYFDLMMKYCEKMIRDEKAYCDDTDAETMKLEREQKKESKNRTNDISTNLNKWNEMISGSVEGLRWCVRAKIDMQSVNGCMRDPTIYRCKCEPHLKTGLKYKVYPTYDFACPIVDSIEGVTHALRTTEYHDRDEQYMWFLKQLQLRNIHVWEYSRLNMINTVLSKRKLTWFVSEGLVDGWDDPRFPTVRGVLRRGMTVQGLKDFIVAQGGSRSVVTMEWDKIWAFNKKVIDPIAPRFTAIDKNNVPVTVTGATEESLKVPKHPKNEIIGLKDVWTSSNILIDEADAETLKEGENTTFINWGNLLIEKINRNGAGKVTSVIAKPNLENKDYKKTLKLTWLAKVKSAPMIPCVCVYFDHIISKAVLDRDDDFKKYIAKNTRIEVEMLGDPELRHLKKSDVIQLQRKGFFICDSPYVPLSPHSSCESPIILFYIPDGHMKELATLGLNKIRESSPKEVKQSARGKSAEKSPLGEVPYTVIGANELQKLNEAITAQGDKVRQLKASNSSKEEVTASVKELLNLKSQYKKASGKDWVPQAAAPAVKETSPSGATEVQLNEAITAQGDKVRQLKSSKASKEEVTNSVKVLLDLKAQYKKVSGKDWQPQATVAINEPTPSCPNDLQQLNAAITAQGDKVRQLKGSNSSKEEVTASVKVLLDLKAQYKKASGKDWQPQATAAITEPTPSFPNDLQQLNEAITAQGDKVRLLKASNSSKEEVTASVKVLLDLKAQYKKASGKDWQPQAAAAVTTEPSSKERKTSENQQKVLAQAKMGVSTEDPSAVELKAKIDAQGEKVRHLKTSGGAASDVQKEVDALLELKNQYKQLTGEDLAGGGKSKKGKKEKKAETKQEPAVKPKAVETASANNPGLKKVTRLGLETTKEESLSDWYTQVITKAEMIEYYDVSGCYILRPWAFSIWEAITNFFDAEIKKIGVQNCYFPMFISQSALNKEKTHIADFAPEVAWVTKSGDSDLAEPIAIRPTSETVMYPSYAKWIKSHRDLPLKLNQWCSVVRWEFKHPQPFLRTREFLWQEGHSAFATRTEAEEEVYTILELYRRVYEELMAIPVIKGKKTEKEKFAGGDFTTTIEAYVSCSGRGLQAATSHHLGQNFSKMFEIIIDHPETGEKQFVYQNSWGLSTRSIGALVMIHADNTGLVLPPRVACVQIVIVPCGVTANTSEGDNKALITKCEEYERKLKEAGVRTRGDYRDNYSPGWKFNHWELKGVPIRLEVGPRDIKQGQCVAVRRDNGEKVTIKEATAVKDLLALLETIHTSLFNKAKKDMDNHLTVAHEWKEFCDKLDKKNIIQSPFCGEPKCEEEIKNDSAKDESSTAQGPSMGAKSLCIPFVQPGELKADAHCINSKCKNKPKFYTLFGRSY